MSTSISGLGGSAPSFSGTSSSGYPQSIIRALQNAGIIGGAGGTESGAGGIGVAAGSSTGGLEDASQLSPLAQVLSPLQQLQQSNTEEYQQVTAQIAANLTSAAQSAQSTGNSTAANELNQLATDFTTASQTGQLPNIPDLAQAVSDQNGSSGDQSQNPLAIIQGTLVNLGIPGGNQ